MRHTTRRRSVTAITAAIALAVPLAAVGVTGGLTASAPTSTELAPAAVEQRPSVGRLELQTGSTDRIVRFDAADAQLGTQGLGAGRNCLLATDDSLLGLAGFVGSGTTDLASFLSDSIGVAEKRSGTSCGQVGSSNGERLLLTLPASSGGLPALIESARLDVELKQGARILATAYRGVDAAGERVPVAYFDLAGATVAQDRLVNLEAPLLPYDWDRLSCGNRADNGPDSGPGDNCSWPIAASIDSAPVLFDALELRAVAGSFSLEGGGDYGASAAANRSVFQLVTEADGILECVGANSLTLVRPLNDEVLLPQIQFRRLGNATEEPVADPIETNEWATTVGCEPVPYTLQNQPSTAQFLKPLDQQLLAQFVAEFVWVREPGADASLPATKIDFETGQGEFSLDFCSAPIYSGTREIDGVVVPKLVGIEDPLAQPDLNSGAGPADGTQYACVGQQLTRVVSGKVRVIEQVYVLGDVRMRTP